MDNEKDVDSGAIELYRRYRPKKFEDMIGQPEAKEALLKMTGKDSIAQVICFAGQTGGGKTTSARILKRHLKCKTYREVNCASMRGIDTIREIDKEHKIKPLAGKNRIYLLDEFHRLTKDAQAACLIMFENTPRWCYFFICTSQLNQVIPAIRGRFTIINFKAIGTKDLKELIERVAKSEKIELSDKARNALVEAADGSARQALKILELISHYSKEEKQLKVISEYNDDLKAQAFEIVRALLYTRPDWTKMSELLRDKVDMTNPAGLIQLILQCATTELLKANKSAIFAYKTIVSFEGINFYASDIEKRAAIASRCCELLMKK